MQIHDSFHVRVFKFKLGRITGANIFQENKLEILVSQHAEDRGTTAMVTHKLSNRLQSFRQAIRIQAHFCYGPGRRSFIE